VGGGGCNKVSVDQRCEWQKGNAIVMCEANLLERGAGQYWTSICVGESKGVLFKESK
jgi:hypothetical protein